MKTIILVYNALSFGLYFNSHPFTDSDQYPLYLRVYAFSCYPFQ